MNPFDRMRKMKQKLYDDLQKVIDDHHAEVGVSLDEVDVIGVIEKVKFDYMFRSACEDRGYE